MPVTISTFSNNTILTASGINSMFESIEEFINGGITSSDIQSSSKWVEERKVVRPTFFITPSKKTQLVSSDVHERFTGNLLFTHIMTNDITQDFTAIPGLSATVYADLNQDESSTCFAAVHCTFFCQEKEAIAGDANAGVADNTDNSRTDLQVENADVLAATFALSVNGVEQTGTQRYLYWNYNGFAFKNHSIAAMITLNRGMNNISVRVKPEPDGTYNFYQIMIRERNMNIEVIYR